MLKLSHKKNADHLDLFLEGALDSQTSLELQEYLNKNMEGINVLTMHFGKLDYISSAGIRVLLTWDKTLGKNGRLEITGVNDIIRDTFDVTGLLDILTII